MSNNPWNSLADIFAKDGNLDDIPAEAADNILIAWPAIIDCAQKHGSDASAKTALDYGCGGGRFAAKLRSLGYTSCGIDSSSALITNAQEAYGQDVTFVEGDYRIAQQHGPFDLITSIMVFEFIANIEEAMVELAASLKPGGLLVFATHNPEFVVDSLKSPDTWYVDVDSPTHPTRGNFLLGEVKVPMFLRPAEQYRAMMESLDCEQVYEEYPPFTREFLHKYPLEGASGQYSEYLILGFKKRDA